MNMRYGEILRLHAEPPAEAARKVITFLGEVDAFIDFLLKWKHGAIMPEEAPRPMRRADVLNALAARASDAIFLADLRAQPRFVMALAIEEALGIRPTSTLWGLREVKILEETETMWWLVVPECHLGCAVGAYDMHLEPEGSCTACGRIIDLAAPQPTRGRSPLRQQVDAAVLRHAMTDPVYRSLLVADPMGVYYAAWCSETGQVPLGRDERVEIAVYEESPSRLGVVLRLT